ncbi:MAG: HAMP domain-containing protein [Methanosarcinaceae archaeon]|nr:HAMP domain-containing protein [Methanosarcinaceae archaeon]
MAIMDKINDIAIGKKLLGGFGIVLLLTALLGVTAYVQTNAMVEEIELMGVASELQSSMGEARRLDINYALKADQESMDKWTLAVDDVKSHLSKLDTKITNADDREKLATIQAEIPVYEAAFSKMVDDTGLKAVLDKELSSDAQVIDNEIWATGIDDTLKGEMSQKVLTIRREEKNVVAHNSENTAIVDNTIESLKAQVAASSMTISEKNLVTSEIEAYQDKFERLKSLIHDINTGVVPSGQMIQNTATTLYDSSSTAADTSASAAKTAVIVLSVVAIIVGIGIAIAIARSITKPLDEMLYAANKIASGDLNVNMTIRSKDEIGQLAQAVWRMAGSIKDQMEKTNGMLKGIVDPMFVTDENLVITYFNKAVEDVTGYRADEVIGKMKCSEVIKSPYCETTKCGIKSCMASKDIIQGANSTITNRDGKVIPVNVSCAAIFDANGNPIGGMEIAMDISNIKNVVNEAIRVVDNAKDGNLSARADVTAKGDYKKLVDGINDLMDAVAVPINDIKRVASAIAEGDLTKSVEVETRGDLKEFADTIELMQQNLRNIVGDIQESSAKVSATAQEMSASSEEMTSASNQIADTVGEISKGAQSQSSKTEEVSRAMNDMTQTVQEVASNAQKAAEGANESNSGAQGVGKSAEELSVKMGDIQTAVNDSSEVIQELDEKSKQIGEIVSLITSIADQTNLLALNAAIEAARAGEHGRGFAVVADEVRNLAEESGTAAQQIAKLITDIQTGTNDAVTSMQHGTEEVANGAESLNETVESISNIVTSIGSVASMVQDIAAAAEEQSASIEEVTSSVEEVSAISEESAAGTEEASAAVEEQTASMEEMAQSAQELSGMAENLQAIAARFKLENAGANE